MLLFELEATSVTAGVSNVGKAFGHAHHKKDCGVGAHGDTVVLARPQDATHTDVWYCV